jgi:hypothetical protein
MLIIIINYRSLKPTGCNEKSHVALIHISNSKKRNLTSVYSLVHMNRVSIYLNLSTENEYKRKAFRTRTAGLLNKIIYKYILGINISS